MRFFKRSIKWIKKHKILSVLGLVIILLLFFLLRPKPVPVIETQTVRRTDLKQTVSVSGTINAKNSASLSFLAGGLVTYIGAKKGDFVNQYQTIAILDQRTVQKNLETALLNYSEQRNTFDQTKDNNQNRTPQQALNDQMARVLQTNQFDLDKSIKSVELQDIAKQQAVLTAPMAGILTRADIQTAGVNAAITNQFVIVDPKSLVFAMDVDEADIGKITTGQPVDISLDTYPDTIIHGRVNSIDFVTHTTSTNGNAYTVEVQLPIDTTYHYRVGMNGNGGIITAERNNVITVPISALVNNDTVYVKAPNGYEARKVKLGLQSDTDAQVISGLNAGDKIVLQPNLIPKASIKG